MSANAIRRAKRAAVVSVAGWFLSCIASLSFLAAINGLDAPIPEWWVAMFGVPLVVLALAIVAIGTLVVAIGTWRSLG